MKCPACPEVLVTVELDGVEADWCAACGGVWLDKGELGLLCAGGPAEADKLLSGLKPSKSAGPAKPSSAAGHPPRKCPICSARMTVVAAEWDGTVHLDECPKRDGIWFDRGELERTLRETGTARIPAFLANLFGKK